MKKLFKHLLATAIVGLSATSVFSCAVPESTTDGLRHIVDEQGGYPISDAQCALLNGHHLRLYVEGDAMVLDGVNLAWAHVSLVNPDRVIASKSGIATKVNTKLVPSQDVANKLFYEALESAINSLDWKGAVAQFSPSGKALMN
ncbi:hypothetical protein P3T18_001072 [Paraburkholderia sp. GAS199]|uniref:hypothetical protein n=1 Tax=Paraburkholderia sp. GAS199 TaxID=3035126 RepID=UPI003D23FE0F